MSFFGYRCLYCYYILYSTNLSVENFGGLLAKNINGLAPLCGNLAGIKIVGR